MRNRPPRQLLLALLGDQVLDHSDIPVRAGAFIAVLESAGVAEPAARATLDRMARQGFLSREKQGREILFRLTDAGISLLDEASERVRGDRPFEPKGGGWTLVTFSVPEEQRSLRHRVRSTLTWEGFAPLRDGLWLAPGEVDLRASLRPLRDQLEPGAIVAFRAHELDEFPIAGSVGHAWDIEAIRRAHLDFVSTWEEVSSDAPAGSSVTRRTELVADWLLLLRTDPGLPPEYMGADWPAAESVAVYRRLRDGLAGAAAVEFAVLAHGGAKLAADVLEAAEMSVPEDLRAELEDLRGRRR